MELPSLRRVLTELLIDLDDDRSDSSNDPSRQTSVAGQTLPLTIEFLPSKAERALVALHQLYPHLLLSSLDLLDNGLVTRYILARDFHSPLDIEAPIYYVRSSQTRTSRYAASATSRSVYEVRPRAWHCTCPSFTFSAFSSRQEFNPFDYADEDDAGSDRWGGEMKGGQLAICKHLLAVVIGERLQVISTKEVDLNTLANYAFGDA
jgi:hypothetical protein